MVMSLIERNPVNKSGAGAGMIVGPVIVTVLTMGRYSVGSVLPFLPSSLRHLNVGVLALAANIVHSRRCAPETFDRFPPLRW